MSWRCVFYSLWHVRLRLAGEKCKHLTLLYLRKVNLVSNKVLYINCNHLFICEIIDECYVGCAMKLRTSHLWNSQSVKNAYFSTYTQCIECTVISTITCNLSIWEEPTFDHLFIVFRYQVIDELGHQVYVWVWASGTSVYFPHSKRFSKEMDRKWLYLWKSVCKPHW